MKIKKTVAVLAGLVLAASTFGQQGVITFNNSSTSKVIDTRTGLPVIPGVARAGLYFSTELSHIANPDGTANDGFIIGAITDISTSPLTFLHGLYNGGNVELPGTSPGQSVLVQIRAWEHTLGGGDITSFEDAWQNHPGAYVGASDMFGPIQLGGGAIPPPATSGFVNSFDLTPVPEPSTVVLGVLGGLGAMVLLRRRK